MQELAIVQPIAGMAHREVEGLTDSHLANVIVDLQGNRLYLHKECCAFACLPTACMSATGLVREAALV